MTPPAPEEHRTTNWTAIFVSAFAAIAAAWKGITGVAQLARTAIDRLNAQEREINSLKDEVGKLRTKDGEQQTEIDDLKRKLEISEQEKLNALAEKQKSESEKLTLEIKLAAARESIDQKNQRIASLEREKHAAQAHSDALDIKAKVQEIAAVMPNPSDC